MPKPAHGRVTFEGVVGSVAAPLERWSFNVNFPADPGSYDGPQVLDDYIAASLRDVYEDTIATYMPSDVILTTVKNMEVDGTGHVVKRADGSYAQGVWTGSVAGPQAAQPMPLNVALCVSLVTSRAGATGKGRFFLPWPGIVVEAATKRITAANAQAIAEICRDFLNGLDAVKVNPAQVVSSKGYMTAVTGVRVGRTPDTMRSRREDSPEGYVSVPLAA